MDEFAACSKEDQISHLEALGRNALADFEVVPTSMSPLVHAENTTFRVQSSEGEFCLRISRPGYQSTANIRSEIVFLAALSEVGRHVPRPWQPRVVTASAPGVPEERDCVLFHWIEGEICRQGLSREQAIQSGELAARLHAFVEGWTEPPGFDRQRVHTWLLDHNERLNVETPSPMVREEDRMHLLQVMEESRQLGAGLPKSPTWIRLIHSDLHPANIVVRDEQVFAIDFDDTGYGFLIYDFAAMLSFKVGKEGFDDYRDAVSEGYSRIRPLPPQTEELLPAFLRLRMASLCNWVTGRADNPELREIGPDFIAGMCERIKGLR
ncbi:MAG TPA: phosphotransferase [Fimbriimonas sp.]|nr:phosphotransferase [Fimbriimonas sp.]